MTRSTGLRRGLALGAMSVLAVISMSCSSSGSSQSSATTSVSAAYCAAWGDLTTAFGNYDKIDLLNGGIDSVRSYFNELEAAATSLKAESDTLLAPKVEAFSTSLQDLVTTLTSTSLPVNRAQQVRDAKAAVDTSWNDLVTTVKTNCPGVTASTV